MNNELYGMTKENLMRTFPAVLDQDEGMNPLGQMIADALSKLMTKADLVKIYSRIDELDETVLDTLAKDFDVVWYDYNYSLETKRALIKDSFYVHRRLGTKGALDRALSDIFPNSTVWEWFEYGGDPYCFRVVVDVTKSREPAHIGMLKRAIEYYKSFRSHLEEDDVVVRITCGIVIRTAQSGIGYSVPKCGTIPAVSTQGRIEGNDVIVNSQSRHVFYVVPKSGTSKVGVAPAVSTQGGIEDKNVIVNSQSRHVHYPVPKAGTSKAGVVPAVSTQGRVEDSGVIAVATALGGLYSTPKCGTSPNALN